VRKNIYWVDCSFESKGEFRWITRKPQPGVAGHFVIREPLRLSGTRKSNNARLKEKKRPGEACGLKG